MSQQTLQEQVDQRATVGGVARDAHAGAVVLTADRTPVYIAGLDSWSEADSGRRVQVTGLLRHRRLAPEPVVGPDGGISHGIEGACYVLEDASWTVEPS